MGDFNARSGLSSDFIKMNIGEEIGEFAFDIESKLILGKNFLEELGFPTESFSWTKQMLIIMDIDSWICVRH